MNRLRPFFDLLQRPLVLFGAIGWMIMATFLLGQLVSRGEVPGANLDSDYLTVVALSGFAGWLIGSCILEFQQSTFAWTLPGGGNRLLWGFALFSLGAVLAAVLLIRAASPVPPQAVPLFLTGSGAIATGAALRDPDSRFNTGLGVALLLLLLASSETLARWATQQPLALSCLTVALIAVGAFRLFNRGAFRRRSVEPGRRVLVFSAADVAEANRSREGKQGASRTTWRGTYLGTTKRGWLKAAWHETHGGVRAGQWLRTLGGSWGLFLILLLEAYTRADELGFWRSVCWVLHDGLMRAPVAPLTGERSGLFVMVALLVVISGVSLAVWRPVALTDSLFHPVSRRRRADVMYAGSVLDTAILVVGLIPLLTVLGHGAGILAGIPTRFDYLPFFLRVLLVTLILLPFAYWGGLRLRTPDGMSDRYSMVGVALGMVVFASMALLLVWLSGQWFPSDAIELLVLVVLILLSRVIYRRWLMRYFETADLA